MANHRIEILCVPLFGLFGKHGAYAASKAAHPPQLCANIGFFANGRRRIYPQILDSFRCVIKSIPRTIITIIVIYKHSRRSFSPVWVKCNWRAGFHLIRLFNDICQGWTGDFRFCHHEGTIWHSDRHMAPVNHLERILSTLNRNYPLIPTAN